MYAIHVGGVLYSGVAPANQTKQRSVHELFAGAFSGTKVEFVILVLVFLRKKTPEFSQKWAKFMNFSFWPFLWFGLLGRLLIYTMLGANLSDQIPGGPKPDTDTDT